MWGAPKCGGPGAQAPVAPPLIRRCLWDSLRIVPELTKADRPDLWSQKRLFISHTWLSRRPIGAFRVRSVNFALNHDVSRRLVRLRPLFNSFIRLLQPFFSRWDRQHPAFISFVAVARFKNGSSPHEERWASVWAFRSRWIDGSQLERGEVKPREVWPERWVGSYLPFVIFCLLFSKFCVSLGINDEENYREWVNMIKISCTTIWNALGETDVYSSIPLLSICCLRNFF